MTHNPSWRQPRVPSLHRGRRARWRSDERGTPPAAGFDVHVYGSEHAVLHQDIPMIANVGFMLDGEVFHPGDALTVPEDRVGTLLLPASAPWLKLSEMIDYARTVAPRRGYTIHDALFSDTGLTVLGAFLGMAGDQFAQLENGASVDL